ncbi:MAG: glycosyltransferase family 2 protein, partial [Anaerolineae bacterium]|nr:glycosyltransferase family 2 protein [Anaerolineae bacterium]
MTVFVGIVIYDSRDDLEHCLSGLRAQTYADIHCVAIDNASSDDSVPWIRQYASDVELIENGENIGYGRAHNQIIAHCQLGADDYYLALNPDAELEPNYIEALVNTLKQTPDTGWASGKLLMKDDAGTPTGKIYSTGHGLLRSGFAFNIGYGLPDDVAFLQSREVFGAPGAAVMYKQALIEDIAQDGQLFDPMMFMYGEDVDVDWRARRAGWRCWYVANAVAYHRGSWPRARLQIMGIGNRYLSVIKNADLVDLLFCSLPYMAA